MGSAQEIFEKLAGEGPVSNDKLITEDEILTEEERQKKASDCNPNSQTSTKPKKACANCTCGLAEELEQEAQGSAQSSAPKTSCGSCYLGDAFRCASCPYRGMPAFKPGEKVTIDLENDDIVM